MAFSLESALILPLVLSSWLACTLAGVPAAVQTRQAAHLEGRAAACKLENNTIYQAVCLHEEEAWTTGLKTSPQAILELVTLIGDDCRLISRIFPGLDADITEPAVSVP